MANADSIVSELLVDEEFEPENMKSPESAIGLSQIFVQSAKKQRLQRSSLQDRVKEEQREEIDGEIEEGEEEGEEAKRKNRKQKKQDKDLNDLLSYNKSAVIAEDIVPKDKTPLLSEDALSRADIDKNGRNSLHRAAFEQNHELVKKIFISLGKTDIEILLKRKDKYGNTPILNACVGEDNQARFKCLQQFQNYREKITDVNPKSGWSAVHWCAFYGDINSLKILCNKRSIIYLPDIHGFFPIDLAGKNNHKFAVQYLLQKLFELIDGKDTAMETRIMCVEFVKKRLNRMIIFSPMLHTSMLFWACYFKNLTIESKIGEKINTIEKEEIIMKLLTKPYYYCYSRLPNLIMEEKTPIHACAMQGNLEGLKLLCEDIRREPIRGDKQDSKKAILCADFVLKEEEEKIDIGYKIYHVLLDKLLSHKSFSHLKKQWVMIKHYHKEKKKKNFLNQKDKFGNTALHLGSINGKARCVEYLINNFNARIDQRNNYGWMAEELIQYKEVKEVYAEYDENILGMNQRERQEKVNKNVLKNLDQRGERKSIPAIPLLVLELKCSSNLPKMEKRADALIDILDVAKFDVKLVKGVKESIYFVLLTMPNDTIYELADKMDMKAKVVDKYSLRPFENEKKTEFEPFRSLEKQTVMLSHLGRIIDIEQEKTQNLRSLFLMNSYLFL